MATKRAFNRNIRDRALIREVAMPGAPGSVYTGTIDLEARSDRAVFTKQIEAVLKIPKVPSPTVANTETITLTIETSATTDFAAVTTLASTVFTAAGTAGIPASEVRASLPTELQRYLRGKLTTGTGVDSTAAYTAELALVI